jgi:hypothetical protein
MFITDDPSGDRGAIGSGLSRADAALIVALVNAAKAREDVVDAARAWAEARAVLDAMDIRALTHSEDAAAWSDAQAAVHNAEDGLSAALAALGARE